MILELNSAASVVDTETLIVYAAYQHGGYDVDSGRPLMEKSDIWFGALNDKDFSVVEELLNDQVRKGN